MGWQYNPGAWKALRIQRGYTMLELSEAIFNSSNRTTWAGVENGSHTPSVGKMMKAMDFLNANKKFLNELFVEIKE